MENGLEALAQMENGLEALAQMEYPGRVIIVGKNPDGEVMVIYGLSGRSESSKARRLVQDPVTKAISIEVTDPEQLAKGDPALLVYNAMAHTQDTIMVSNGVQTDLIEQSAKMYRRFRDTTIPLESLLPMAFCEPHIIKTKDGRKIDITSFEPDYPNYTPRISGAVQGNFAVLNVIKRSIRSEPLQIFYRFNLEDGEGRMISTYNGENKDPLPSFEGEPRRVLLVHKDPKEMANAVYLAMGKFAVSAACYMPKDHKCGIMNLHRGGEDGKQSGTGIYGYKHPDDDIFCNNGEAKK